jgi:RND family efflux transporter MFP subunit
MVGVVGRLSAMALLLTALAGCDHVAATSEPSKTDGDAPAPASGVEVLTVTGRPYVQTVELPGASVHGMETTLVMAKVGGYLEEIKRIDDQEVDIGSRVAAGDVLAVLDVPEMLDELRQNRALVKQAESEVLQAVAGIQQARADVRRRELEVEQAEAAEEEARALLRLRETEQERISRLVKSQAVQPELLDEAVYQLEAARAAGASAAAAVKTAGANVLAAQAGVAKAEADKVNADARVNVAEAVVSRLETLYKYTQIKAPFEGVIVERMVDRGAFVRPATNNSGAMPLFKITRVDRLRIVASVPVTKAAKVEVGQKAVFSDIGGLPGVAIAGEVTRSALALDQGSRMMRIEVHVDNPAPDLNSHQKTFLQPGMFGTVTVTLNSWDQHDPLPVVPTSAVGTDENGKAFVVTATDGAFRRQAVEIAFNDAVDVGISAGLKIGDRIVLRDVEKYK